MHFDLTASLGTEAVFSNPTVLFTPGNLFLIVTAKSNTTGSQIPANTLCSSLMSQNLWKPKPGNSPLAINVNVLQRAKRGCKRMKVTVNCIGVLFIGRVSEQT